jgi:hypothetical protein
MRADCPRARGAAAPTRLSTEKSRDLPHARVDLRWFRAVPTVRGAGPRPSKVFSRGWRARAWSNFVATAALGGAEATATMTAICKLCLITARARDQRPPSEQRWELNQRRAPPIRAALAVCSPPQAGSTGIYSVLVSDWRRGDRSMRLTAGHAATAAWLEAKRAADPSAGPLATGRPPLNALNSARLHQRVRSPPRPCTRPDASNALNALTSACRRRSRSNCPSSPC